MLWVQGKVVALSLSRMWAACGTVAHCLQLQAGHETHAYRVDRNFKYEIKRSGWLNTCQTYILSRLC